MKDIQTPVKVFDLTQRASARITELKWIESLQNQEWEDAIAQRVFKAGISVIIPAYKALGTVKDTLLSLAKQTLSFSKFEVILVCNGPDDGTAHLAQQIFSEYPELQFRIYFSAIQSAGAARNLGLSLAKFEYTTFLDADDQFQPKFLENIFNCAATDKIIASPIVNVENSLLDSENTLNQRIVSSAGTEVPLNSVPWLLGFNACKLVATKHLLRFKYNSSLQSGEDVVFFANLLSIDDLTVVFPKEMKNAAYLRSIRENSVSRQEVTFDFNVRQRVDCIAELREISVPENNKQALQSLENAQLGFIIRFLHTHPQAGMQLESYLASISFLYFPWEYINNSKARDLAISYCFSPYSDTSAVVAEKAIAERGKIVDVISNQMDGVRHIDRSVSFLASRWIDKRVIIDSSPSFNNWELISDFANKALNVAEQLNKMKNYETVYSRALWIGSHVAAALFKNRNPQVFWSAEFSDPLRSGVDGSKRPGNLTKNETAKTLFGMLQGHKLENLEIDTLFDLVELVTMLVADEIIFTNQNQLTLMLLSYPQEIQEQIKKKATVRPHPVPSPSAYFAVESKYALQNKYVNIGYFGSFYNNRGLQDVFAAMLNMNKATRARIRLHIFCNTVNEAKVEIEKWGLQQNILVSNYLPYLEFLNASTKFDVLLVNDVAGGANIDINPFLPSKLSDYRGAGTKIWGLVDIDSPLSKQNLDFSSPVNNSPLILKTLETISNLK